MRLREISNSRIFKWTEEGTNVECILLNRGDEEKNKIGMTLSLLNAKVAVSAETAANDDVMLVV
jgi:hypothetical protein